MDKSFPAKLYEGEPEIGSVGVLLFSLSLNYLRPF